MLIKEFINYVKETESFDWVQVNFPFVGKYNDMIFLWAKKKEGKIVLSDDGFIFDSSIFNLFEKEKAIKILKKYGIEISSNDMTELILECTEKDLPDKLLKFSLAIYMIEYF